MVTASQLTDNLAAWSTVVLAIFTIVLVVFAFVQARFTGRAMDQASDALDQARQDTLEATKARIDERAPRLIVIPEGTAGSIRRWPTNTPLIIELQQGEPVGDDEEIGIAGWFRIENQGLTTALVTLPRDVAIYPLNSGATGLNSVQMQRPTERQELRLRPGDGRLLLVQLAKAMDEWKTIYARPESTRGYFHVGISSTDTFEDGVSDITLLRFGGIPVQPAEIGWIGTPAVPTTVATEKTIRSYRITRTTSTTSSSG